MNIEKVSSRFFNYKEKLSRAKQASFFEASTETSDLRATTEVITKTIADEYLLCKYSGQRPLNEKRVFHYAMEMEKGSFQNTNTIAFAYLDGRKYLINGQHTLHAISLSGISQRLPVAHYFVNTEDQISSLYAHYDIGGIRGYAELYSAYNLQNKFNLTKTTLNYLGFAVHALSRQLGVGTNRSNDRAIFSREETLRLMEEWSVTAKEYIATVYNKDSRLLGRKLLRAHCFALGLLTTKYQPVLSKQFWYEVASGESSQPFSPTKVLRELLLTSRARFGSSGSIKRDLSSEELVIAICCCWNAFTNNKPLKSTTEAA